MPKAPKDPNAPKRALSSYLFYSAKRRPELKEKNPEMKFGEYGKVIGAEWKKMSDSEKKPYEDMATKDKERYEKEMKKYKN